MNSQALKGRNVGIVQTTDDITHRTGKAAEAFIDVSLMNLGLDLKAA